MSVYTDLSEAWAEWQQADLYRKWKRANPGESAKLDTYRGGGARPSLVTATGKALVWETDAWLGSEPVDPPPPPSVPTFTGWGPVLRPFFVPSRAPIVCTTKAQVEAAWATAQTGDLIDVRGAIIPGQLSFQNRDFAGFTEIHFDAACRLTGNKGTGFPAVWVQNCSKLRMYGGDLTNPMGPGAIVDGNTDFAWWGFDIHDVGGTCLGWRGLTRPSERADLRGTVSRNGMDFSLDPHAEKGTGLHGVYTGNSPFPVSGNLFIEAHDLPAGAAIEIGPRTHDTVIELDARRVTFQAQQQVAGNALQWWGDDIRNIRVPYVYGEDLAGRVSETNGIYDTQPDGQITVEHGRSARVRLAPAYATKRGTVAYQDCS